MLSGNVFHVVAEIVRHLAVFKQQSQVARYSAIRYFITAAVKCSVTAKQQRAEASEFLRDAAL